MNNNQPINDSMSSPSPPDSPQSLPPVPTVSGRVNPPQRVNPSNQAVNPPFSQVLGPPSTNGYQNQMTMNFQNGSQPTNQKLRVENYTEKSIIVRGETRPYSSALKLIGYASWIGKPKQGEPGWCFPNFKRTEVEEYVQMVNAGTAETPPNYKVQEVKWAVFKPEIGMKLKIKMSTGVGDYIVSNIQEEGWMVTRATISCTQKPDAIYQMVVVSGKWQIWGCTDEHTIEPVD